jgi:hypothetical protein
LLLLWHAHNHSQFRLISHSVPCAVLHSNKTSGSLSVKDVIMTAKIRKIREKQKLSAEFFQCHNDFPSPAVIPYYIIKPSGVNFLKSFCFYKLIL